MPVQSFPGWRRAFTDDFNYGVALGSFPDQIASRWWAYPYGWHDTTGVGHYAPERVLSIHNGVLDIYLHSEDGVHLAAAPVPRLPNTARPYGQLYGVYAVRFYADPIPGYKLAWLLWPDSEHWPADGEIDFPEGNLTGRMCGHVHLAGGLSGADQTNACGPAIASRWHTAALAWTPSGVVFAVDDQILGITTTRIPHTSMHFVLQTETSTDGPGPSGASAGHVLVDWVSIYSPA